MPRVSVIIPTYNRCAYVQEAIDSVLAQTYTDYEIIVIDDGSTDGTGEALRERYGGRIRYVLQDNQRQSAARNTGVRMAEGELLAFLDSDDRFLPFYLQEQVAALAANPNCGLVCCGAYLIDQAGARIGTEIRPWEVASIPDLEHCIIACPILLGYVLLQKRHYVRVGGLDHALQVHEDWDLFLRLLLSGVSFAWNKAILCEYRVHPGSVQHDALASVDAIERLIEKALTDPRVPASVSGRAAEIRLHHAVDMMGRCFGAGAHDMAMARLTWALAHDPRLGDERSGRVLQALVDGVQWGATPDPYERLVAALGAIAPQVDIAKREQRAALAVAAQRGFYVSWSLKRYRSVLRSFLRAAWRAPKWLANRGTWSILLRSAWQLVRSELRSAL